MLAPELGAAMRRREFISLLGGAVAAWPLTARAQQPDRARRVGVLESLAADDPESQSRLAAFVQALGELGWTVGRNVGRGGSRTPSQARGRAGHACTRRHIGKRRLWRRANAASDPHRANRVRTGH